jgi:chromosomal replication initiator protein
MTDMDYEGFWNEALVQLRANLGEEEFCGWFTDLKYLRAGENSVCIGVPSTFHRDKVKTRYQNAIKNRLKELIGREIGLDFEVIPGNEAENAYSRPAEAAKQYNDTGLVGEYELVEGEAAVPATDPVKPKKTKHPQLRDDFTFDRYIIGENNRFAASAAISISRNPGIAYNPFYIYGGVGLGKTHLMQAIGNYIYENSDNKIISITAEDFLNEYVQLISESKITGENRMDGFKKKFRNTDVLLIDDIQIFEGKQGVQEELFHTYNTLLSAKKQLVFTCDRPITELKKFSERLLTRFTEGISVDLQPPRYEERCAILKSTAESRGAVISDEVIDLISKNISSNIRDLKSALNTLIAYTELTGQPISMAIAQQKLKDVFASPRQANLSIENIIKVVAEDFGLVPNDLKGKKRSQNIVLSRQVAMYVTREITDYSTTEIGQAFGGRDHTTVMHSIEKIKNQLITDPAMDSTIESLKRLIKDSSVKS